MEAVCAGCNTDTDAALAMCLSLSLPRCLQAVTSHPGGLGSGWRMVILALRLGAADGSPPVMAQTQEALQVGQCLFVFPSCCWQHTLTPSPTHCMPHS